MQSPVSDLPITGTLGAERRESQKHKERRLKQGDLKVQIKVPHPSFKMCQTISSGLL
jgi:hypothetical protein